MLVHTIWIQDPSGSRTFDIGEWLSLLSLLRNTDYNVVLHTNLVEGQAAYDPYKIVHDRFLVRHRNFEFVVNGVRLRPANISDMERIRILHAHGGIYSDLDIWWVKPLVLDPSVNMVAAFENPGYGTVTNAFLACPNGGWAPLLQLLNMMEGRIAALHARGIVDVTGNPAKGVSKHHTLLWKLTGEFLKERGAVIYEKSHFYKNGWRRIGRELMRLGVPLKPSTDVKALGTAKDRFSLVGSSGFHYFAELFTAEQVLQIPQIKELFVPVLEWGASWLNGAAPKGDRVLVL